MTDFLDFPDLEAVVAATLRAADLGAGWYSSVPKTPHFPLGTVKRIGGAPAVRRYLDAPHIQIDVWGNTKSEARDIAARARTTVFQLEGTAVTDPVSAWISAVDDALGLTWSPDPETGRDRYVFAVIVRGR